MVSHPLQSSAAGQARTVSLGGNELCQMPYADLSNNERTLLARRESIQPLAIGFQLKMERIVGTCTLAY